METLFSLGRLLATPGALDAANRAGENLLLFFCRHAAGDWGNMDPDDGQANDAAVRDGERILSAYPLDPAAPRNGTVWVITEADRSMTTLLCPDEY